MDRSDRDFSVFVSNTMDTIGYSKDMVNTRRELFVERFKLVAQNTRHDSQFIIGGSKGEGISRLCESDIDVMHVTSDILCAEEVNLSSADVHSLVQLDMRHPAPGYTRLSLFVALPGLVMSNEGIAYIPNTYFQAHFARTGKLFMSFRRQGPAFCMKFSKGCMSSDFVPSYRCQCPSLLNAWLSRRRTWNWPTEQQLQEISTLDAHVVAVGHKRSYEQELEWRICFTLAELALVRSFNDTQTKLYILLKFMAKSVLKPLCGGMTSYVMKNVVLWVTELTNQSLFTPDLLVDRLVHCLKVLSKAVDRGCLPSYMIPDRNLLSGTMRPAERKKLLMGLRELISAGGSMLLRCEKLNLALVKMYETPEMASAEGERLDMFERTYLLLQSVECADVRLLTEEELAVDYNVDQMLQLMLNKPTLSKIEATSTLDHQLVTTVMPDIDRLRSEGKRLENVFWNRYYRLLSQLS